MHIVPNRGVLCLFDYSISELRREGAVAPLSENLITTYPGSDAALSAVASASGPCDGFFIPHPALLCVRRPP